MLLALAFYDRLPDQMPIHFDSAGIADNYASKAVAGFAIPGGMALLNLLVHFFLNTDPKRDNTRGAARTLGLWLVPVLSIVCSVIMLYKGMGYDVSVETIIPVLLGVVFVVIGNYLPKCKQNYTVGIKLPWTLSSENNWNKTHRLAGVIWMAGGLAMVACSLLQVGMQVMIIAVIIFLVFVPMLYSYILYRKGV